MCGEKVNDSVSKMDGLYTKKNGSALFVCIMGEIQMENKCVGGLALRLFFLQHSCLVLYVFSLILINIYII